MNISRREMMGTLAALAAARPAASAGGAAPEKGRLGLVIHSYWVRRARPLPPEFPPIADPLAFLELGASLGAPGVQTKIPAGDPAALARLRGAAEARGMVLEATVGLPRDEADLPRFEAELAAAKAAGATIARTVCMPGRRYETFDSLEKFREFAGRSWTSLTLAEPLARKLGVRLAVENHKDWRIDEMTAWLKRLSSEAVGVCLDTGNSVALLEDPTATAEALAPWTITTHLKDMAVAPADDGFLLAEVPLGDGFLDLPGIAATLKKANPDVRWNLEMITRDPLRVPCLTPKYWATLGEVRASELAEALARVRRHAPARPLPIVTGLPHAEQLRAEAANIGRSLAYAGSSLRL